MFLVAHPVVALNGTSVSAAPPETGAYSTVVFAQLWNGTVDVTANTDYEVTAFVGAESRATGKAIALPDGGTVLVFRIWGNTGIGGVDETGQKVTFILHDRVGNKDYDLSTDEEITFRGDFTYGMPSEPVALHFFIEPVIPIETLKTGKDHLQVYLAEIDIRERLDELVTVLPAETKQTYHWEVKEESEPGMFTFNETTGFIDAKLEGTATFYAVADADPTVRSAGIKVTVLNPARTLSADQTGLTVYLDGKGSLDVSDDVNALIHIGPSGYSTINITYSSSDPTVVATHRDAKSGQQVFQALKTGTAVITTKLTYLNCYTEKDSTLSLDLSIYVSVPLKGVTVSQQSLTVCRDDVAMLTLTAQPEGAVLTRDCINLTLADARIAQVGDFTVEEGLSSVDVPIIGLFPGTTSVLNALEPEGKAETLGTVDVQVATQLDKGWQWVTFYLPSTISGKALEDAFGNALTEVRSQSQFLFNDPDYGYIGSLVDYGLQPNECYKINMAAAASHVFGRPKNGVEPYAGGTVYINDRWTWLGNPYYCSHPIEDYVSGAKEDDMIVGQDAFAVFLDGHWRGSLEALYYGEAYMYYADQSLTTLRLKAEGYVSDLPVEEEEEEELEDEEEVKPAFAVSNGHRFMDNMCLIATLGSGFSATDKCQIAAFVGDDCRGIARIQDGFFFLTVHGEAGETINLRLFDEDSGTYYNIQGTMPLQPRAGSMKSPLLVNKGGHDTLVLDVSESTSEDCYYTLQGIRLRQAPRKGIYIYKGHKVVVRI